MSITPRCGTVTIIVNTQFGHINQYSLLCLLSMDGVTDKRFIGHAQWELPTAFDLAAFRLSMITPVKKSVNHSRTVASMRETGWE